MTELFTIKGWTPDAAAEAIRVRVPNFAEGACDARYAQLRRTVREALVNKGIMTIRTFTSAVLYMLYGNDVYRESTLPDYYISDITMYLAWKKEREGSMPLPPNIEVTINNTPPGGANGRHFADFSGIERRILEHTHGTVTGRTSSSTQTIQDYLSSKLGKEPTMITKTPVFEKRVFINGVDATILSDDKLFETIETLEREVERLNAIQAKPQKLGKKIAKLYKDIDRIKAYVDAR